ncbi:MAG: hypothetical protein KJ749_10135 [Planctomycetes bacterium]|nr:hypothetical protein [Planctomycetota bacterium]
MAGPVKKWNAGQVSCALWSNEIKANGRIVPMLKCSVERRYADKDGNWKSSGSFSRNEIPLVIHVLQQAFAAMIEAGKEQEQQPRVEEEFVE